MPRRTAMNPLGAIAVALLAGACTGVGPSVVPTESGHETCVDLGSDIVALAWGGAGQTAVVATAVGVDNGADDTVWIVDAPSGRATRLIEGPLQGGASLGPGGDLVWVESSGGTTRELWERDAAGNERRLDAGEDLLEAFATSRGVVLSENASGETTRYLLLGPNGRPDELFDLTPRTGATWVSPDGGWIASLRPTPDQAPGGILNAWTAGSSTDLEAPEPLYLVGLSADRQWFLYSPLDRSSELWKVPVQGGAPSRVASLSPFNSLAVSDAGRIAYSGLLGGADASRLCVLHDAQPGLARSESW